MLNDSPNHGYKATIEIGQPEPLSHVPLGGELLSVRTYSIMSGRQQFLASTSAALSGTTPLRSS